MFIKSVKAASIVINNPLPGVTSIGGLVSRALGYVLPIVGIIFVVMIIYAGITYQMSASDPGKVKQAQAMLVNAVIGFAITVFAFAIRALVEKALGVT